jgi:hypothetical protein
MLPPVNAGGVAIDLGLALLVLYLVTLWAGGWALEVVARAHFRRAQRYAHAGFVYDAELDRYECPQGELLTLHTYDDRNKLAIYKAPAASCNDCVLKAFCTPRDEGRHVYHSLADFHETDVGRFHRRLSLAILGVALAFSAGGLAAYRGRPGGWVLAVTTGVSVVLLGLDACDPRGASGRDGEDAEPWWRRGGDATGVSNDV